MRRKIMKKLVVSMLLASILTTGCSSKTTSNPSQNGKKAEGGSVKQYGEVISLKDIKEKYSEKTSEVMPLYNVEPDETFEFNFKMNFEDANSSNGMVTVHTDAACKEESEIYVYNNYEETENRFTLKVSPISGVLLNESQDDEYVASLETEEEKNIWGNAPIYYIAIHYDMDADTLVELEQPIIIPFTVKQQVQAPNVSGVVDSTGRFKLVWEPVEGATEYIIYNLRSASETSQWTGSENAPVKGAEYGYNECSLIYENRTTETEYDNFEGGNSHGLAIHERSVSDRTYVIGQNFSVAGEYYVSAVVNGVESGFNESAKTSDLILPYKLTDECDIMFEGYTEVSQLPLTLDVINIDGSITPRKVLYTLQWERTYIDTEFPEYAFSVEGTAITGCVSMSEAEDYSVLPDTVGENTPSGNVKPDNNINKLPGEDVDTIIRPSGEEPETTEPETTKEPTTEATTEATTEGPTGEPTTEEPTSEEPESEAPNSEEPNGLVDDQIDNTKKHIENANGNTVANPGENVVIFADTAAEEWIALNMINGEAQISVEGFPELQNPYTLEDVFYKVYYQNPYILGLYTFGYDYQNLTLTINYVYDKDELSKMQQEIASKAEEITGTIIKDGMNDEEKRLAIYSYLEDNCEYDNEALADAEKHDFRKTGESTYEAAFNTYGILVNKKGVCQSYAYAYKLLSHFSNLDSVVITGNLNGNLPHAWNAVKIDNKWYQVDTTNNGKTTGIPFYLYNADTDTAEQTGYTEDALYELDSLLTAYETNDDTYEYYYANQRVAEDMNSYGTILDKIVNDTDTIICVRYTADTFDQDELIKIVGEVYNKHGLENKLSELKFGSMTGYLILLSE